MSGHPGEDNETLESAACRWFAGLGHPAFAQTALDAVKQAGALRIGTEGTYAPFTFHDASGALVGFDVEIGRAIAKQIGVEAEFVEGPWDGLIAGIDADRYDVVINQVGINADRQAKYDFSEPYIASKAALVVRGDNTEITSFEDLAGKNSAQTLTSNFGKLAEGYGATLVGTEGFDQSIALVIQGRADATINDSLSFFDFKKQQPRCRREGGCYGRRCRFLRRAAGQGQARTAGRHQRGSGGHQG
jgi:cystine transport system substrate-binding protein